MTSKLRIDEAVDLYGNIKRVKFQGYYHERSQIRFVNIFGTDTPFYHDDYFMFYDEDEVYHLEHKPTRQIIYTFRSRSWDEAEEKANDFIYDNSIKNKIPLYLVGQEVVVKGLNKKGVVREIRNVIGTKHQARKSNVWDYLIYIPKCDHNINPDWFEEYRLRNGKSLMDLFIEEYLNGYYLRETTKEQYESNLLDENHDVVKLQMRDVIDVSDFDNPPHPLKQVVRLVDYSQSWENGSSWALVFQFKHKGKYYIYEDCGDA